MDLTERNLRIFQMYRKGYSQAAVAEQFGIGQQAVSDVVRQVRDAIPATVREEQFAKELDFLSALRDQMLQLVEQPLPPAFNQRGQILRDDNGEPILDYTTRLAAHDRAVKAHERTAKMLGLDAPVKSDVVVTEQPSDEAMQAVKDMMARMKTED